MFRQMTLFGGFVKPEPFFKSINCLSSAGYYETIEVLWVLDMDTGMLKSSNVADRTSAFVATTRHNFSGRSLWSS